MFSISTTRVIDQFANRNRQPPSVMVLIDRPSHLKARIAVGMDSGMAVSEISIVRRLPRKKTARHTKHRGHQQLDLQVAERGLDEIGLTEDHLRRALIPCGTLPEIGERRFNALCPGSTVSAVGCFWMLRDHRRAALAAIVQNRHRRA